MSKHTQPHDRFFAKVFSCMQTIENFLIHNIPPVADLLVPGSLEDCREKFLTPELERYFSDLLLRAKLKKGGEANIFFLLEHKSYHEPDVFFHLILYMIQIWGKEKQKRKPLPFILPIVIYHGKQKWNTDTNFASLVDIPKGMEPYVPHFHYYLYDLSQYNDSEIKGSILTRSSLLLLKHIYDESFGVQFKEICEPLKKLEDKKTALEFMRSVLEYVASASDTITKEQLREGIKEALPQTGEELMPTLFEQIKEEGRQEGWKKGIAEGIEKGEEKGRRVGIQLALELKYGPKGLDLYHQIKDSATLDTLNQIETALRKGASLEELQQLIKVDQTKND